MFGDIADRMESTGSGFRCTGAGCGITVCADLNPDNYVAADTREQIRARLCTHCFRLQHDQRRKV